MGKTGAVSVWIGNGKDRRVFGRLLEYRITENGMGEFEACLFCRTLGIDSYDPDYFEGSFLPKAINRPRLLFHGTELASQIEQHVSELQPSNCCVLLYDYEYDGKCKEFEIDGFHFRFLGCFDTLTNKGTQLDSGGARGSGLVTE